MARSYNSSDYHIGKASPSFVSNMRRLLQVKSAVNYEHGYKSGKIAASRLWRVGMPPIDSGDWNSRVFKRITGHSDFSDTAILLLADASGSMSGTKYQTAAKACALCNDAFGVVLHIPLCIVSFTSSGPLPVMGMMKDFRDRVSADDLADRFAQFAVYMSGNNDADSLLWSYHHILERKEKRKVIIVLSDGSPADGNGDPYYALSRVTESIQNEKLVDLYGLGIMDRNVERFYKKHKVINKIGELEPTLVDLMGKALT
jgi:cobalamin biosynthesis protein CobT